MSSTYSTTSTTYTKTEPAIVGVSPSTGASPAGVSPSVGPKTEEQTKSEGNGFPNGPTI